jgi:hypothetical protein
LRSPYTVAVLLLRRAHLHPGAWRETMGLRHTLTVEQRLALEIETHLSWGVQYWPLFLRETGEHIGCRGFHVRDQPQGVWELGCHLRREFWSQSFGREAAGTVIIQRTQLNESSCSVSDFNIRTTNSTRPRDSWNLAIS